MMENKILKSIIIKHIVEIQIIPKKKAFVYSNVRTTKPWYISKSKWDGAIISGCFRRSMNVKEYLEMEPFLVFEDGEFRKKAHVLLKMATGDTLAIHYDVFEESKEMYQSLIDKINEDRVIEVRMD